jgi:hypothetical protein
MRINLIIGLAFLALLPAPCTAPLLESSDVAPTAPVEIPLVPLKPASEPAPPAEENQPEASGIPTPRARRLWAGELQLAADVDDIPAIFAEDDIFVDAEAGSREWLDEELVIGLELNEDVRAYPIRLLSLHEIVNDTVGGRPVAVTWCPLCFSAIVFDRRVDDKELTFGVSGLLYFNNLVMYDHRTETLWSQMLGEAIKGALRGDRLEFLPSLMTSWGEWKRRHPVTKVLSAEAMGRNADEIIDPYVGYYTSGAAGVTGWANESELLKAKELVAGVQVGEEARGYPFEIVHSNGLINDRLNDIPLLLAFIHDLETVAVYRAEANGQALTFSDGSEPGLMRDDQSGSLWEVQTGQAVDGPLAGSNLPRLAAPLVFWFAWSDIHTNSDVYVE